MLAALRRQDGNVVATAMLLIAAMMMIGLAAASRVDTQSGQSRVEREWESTFNLAEGTLSAQTYVLGRKGTGTQEKPFPDRCTPTSTADLCPDADALGRSYDQASQVDFGGSTTWTSEVRDNTSGDFYDGAEASRACNNVSGPWCWDKNGDDRLWVRSEATVRGRKRGIVALIKVEKRNIEFPRYAIAGGWFETSNQGNKLIVDGRGGQGVTVRCTPPPPSKGCLDYDPAKGQIAGSVASGYPNQGAITPDDLQALEDYARSRGTYYENCSSWNPNGAVVVVENGPCNINNSDPAVPGATKCCNSPTSPGLLIIKRGTLTMTGNIEFYGLIYMANLGGVTGTVVDVGGTVTVSGGVTIDGPGGMAIGSSGKVGNSRPNVEYNPRAFDNIVVAGAAGVVQNTWREIPVSD